MLFYLSKIGSLNPLVSHMLILLVALFLWCARANSARTINSSSSKVTLETCSIDKLYTAYSLRIIDNLPLHLSLHTNSPNIVFVLYSIDT